MYDQKLDADIERRTSRPGHPRGVRINMLPDTSIYSAEERLPSDSVAGSEGSIHLTLENMLSKSREDKTYDAVICGTGWTNLKPESKSDGTTCEWSCFALSWHMKLPTCLMLALVRRNQHRNMNKEVLRCSSKISFRILPWQETRKVSLLVCSHCYELQDRALCYQAPSMRWVYAFLPPTWSTKKSLPEQHALMGNLWTIYKPLFITSPSAFQLRRCFRCTWWDYMRQVLQ